GGRPQHTELEYTVAEAAAIRALLVFAAHAGLTYSSKGYRLYGSWHQDLSRPASGDSLARTPAESLRFSGRKKQCVRKRGHSTFPLVKGRNDCAGLSLARQPPV